MRFRRADRAVLVDQANGLEFVLADSGIRFDGTNGEPLYSYYYLDTSAGPRYRCVALRELRYLTRNDREQDDILGRQWAAVRGLYNANVNFLYATGGIFHPRHVGVVQWYGAMGEAESEEAAAEEAMTGLGAVLALLANYPQSRTAAADAERLQWYLDFITLAPRVLVGLGHPDPRMSREGVGQDGASGVADDDLAREQTEMFLRALVSRRKQFIFHITADHVDRRRLADGLVTMARFAGAVASRQRGAASIGLSLAIPWLAAASQGWTGQQGGGRSVGRSHVEGVSESHGQAHTVSESETHSHSHTVTESESWGEATTVSSFHSSSRSVSVGHADTQGSAHTEGTAHTEGQASSSGGSSSVGSSWGASWGQSNTVGGGVSVGHAEGRFSGESHGVSSGSGASQSQMSSDMQGGSVSNSIGGGLHSSVTAGVNAGLDGVLGEGVVPAGVGANIGGSVSGTAGASVNYSHAQGSNWGHTEGAGSSQSTFAGESHGVSSGASEMNSVTGSEQWSATQSQGGFSGGSASSSSFSSQTHSSSDTHSQSDTQSQSQTQSRSVTTSSSSGGGVAHTTSHATGRAESDTVGYARTTGEADTASRSIGRSHSEGYGVSEVASRGGGQAFAGTISRGIVPGISINRSWQMEDDVAGRVTEVLRGLERVLNTASAEGGFLTQAAVFVEDAEAERTAAAAIGQAYHGLNVPTPVLTRPVPEHDLETVRLHTLTARPCTRTDGRDPFGGVLWTRYATLLTAGMLGAYTRPAWFEEGVATTVQEAEPPYAFYPDLKGDVFLGHQYSYETGQLTDAPLLMRRDQMFHTLFAADTGYGKSVAAMRMAYETTKKWKFRTLVMEFSTGWRSLVNAPGLEGRFQIFQLSPGGAFPLRWNPLEIGRHIEPETQWRAFCDVFGGVARLGVRRQVHDFRDVLKRVYVTAGVLVRDREVIEDPQWGKVQPDEEPLVHVKAGTSITELPETALQRIAVHRSKQVGLKDLYREVLAEIGRLPPGDRIARPIMEGIKSRLEPLIYGQVGEMFGAGEGTVAISDLAQPWGICVIEGGEHLDAFSKTFLLAWFGWHAYQDAFTRMSKGLASPEETVQIYYEELNKILSGVSGGDEDGQGGDYVVEQLGQQWVDSRKAKIWLSGVVQAVSLVPRTVQQSCNNIFAGTQKGADDRDITVGAMARSEKGFVDERWRRWLARLPWAQTMVRLGYTPNQAEMEPVKIRPAMLALPKPTDEALAQLLGREEWQQSVYV